MRTLLTKKIKLMYIDQTYKHSLDSKLQQEFAELLIAQRVALVLAGKQLGQHGALDIAAQLSEHLHKLVLVDRFRIIGVGDVEQQRGNETQLRRRHHINEVRKLLLCQVALALAVEQREYRVHIVLRKIHVQQLEHFQQLVRLDLIVLVLVELVEYFFAVLLIELNSVLHKNFEIWIRK